MSWRAYVIPEVMADRVRLGLVQNRYSDGRHVVVGTDNDNPGRLLFEPVADEAAEFDHWRLPAVPVELARELLDALAGHFGGTSNSVQLRRDYDAERGRVDRLIGAIIDHPVRQEHR